MRRPQQFRLLLAAFASCAAWIAAGTPWMAARANPPARAGSPTGERPNGSFVPRPWEVDSQPRTVRAQSSDVSPIPIPGAPPAGGFPPSRVPPSSPYPGPGAITLPNEIDPPIVQPTPTQIMPPPPGVVPPGVGGGVVNGLGPTEDGGPLFPPGGFVQPFTDDGIADLEAVVQETQTGRFSVGVGVNSDAGVLGNIVLDEQNFSIRRWPSSPSDILYGNAFRGDGQHFRVELVPGDEVQRYTVSFTEPYLADTPVSLGLSGFFFTRFFEDWREQRFGGNVSLGYQVRPDLSLTGQLRAEEVRLTNPRSPTPPEVAAVVGESNLYTARLALVNDTRDSAFLPTQGHMLELAYEQGFGEFDYPRATVDARQYFLIHERPDRSGRHVLSLRGRAGVTGSQTPVYEQFFIGGFSTLRGFDFRGASPVKDGTTVGGDFMLLTSVEYLFPLTADDGLRMVFFVDAGTVEEDVELHADSFRVAPGFGLRITVPGMGPAPIALDFAWAINKADTDDTRVFSFFVGLLR